MYLREVNKFCELYSINTVRKNLLLCLCMMQSWKTVSNLVLDYWFGEGSFIVCQQEGAYIWNISPPIVFLHLLPLCTGLGWRKGSLSCRALLPILMSFINFEPMTQHLSHCGASIVATTCATVVFFFPVKYYIRNFLR